MHRSNVKFDLATLTSKRMELRAGADHTVLQAIAASAGRKPCQRREETLAVGVAGERLLTSACGTAQ